MAEKIEDFAYNIYLQRDQLAVTVPTDTTEVLIDGDFVAYHILRKYQKYCFDTYYYIGTSDPVSNFIDQFTHYARVQQYNFYRMWQALRLDYDPVANYNMIEVGEDVRTDNMTHTATKNTTDTQTNNLIQTNTYNSTDTTTNNLSQAVTHGLTQTTTNNLTNTTQHGLTQTTTNNQTRTDTRTPDKLTNTHAVAPFDNASPKTEYTDTQTGKETQTTAYSGAGDTVATSGADTVTDTGTQATSNTGTDNTTNTGTQSTAYSGDDTTTNTGTRTVAHTGYNEDTDRGTERTEHNLSRSGNIGVTTTQQMIDSEIQLRIKNIVTQYIDYIMGCFCYLDYTIDSGGDSELSYYPLFF